jgi:sensor c-di-GMP phosphodiesterase-like protein
MGQNLGLRVVAEGVETQEQLEFLQAHNCDEVQGFYFSRPLCSQEFVELLRTGIATAVSESLTPELYSMHCIAPKNVSGIH